MFNEQNAVENFVRDPVLRGRGRWITKGAKTTKDAKHEEREARRARSTKSAKDTNDAGIVRRS